MACGEPRPRRSVAAAGKPPRPVDSNWKKVKSFLDQLGGVAERSNAAVSKTVTRHSAGREFESPPLRLTKRDPAPDAGSRYAASRIGGSSFLRLRPPETARKRRRLARNWRALARLSCYERDPPKPEQPPFNLKVAGSNPARPTHHGSADGSIPSLVLFTQIAYVS